MLSVAKIPWMGSSFRGFLCAIAHNGEKRLFTTYNGSRIAALTVSDHEVRCEISRGKKGAAETLTLRVSRSRGGMLRAPVAGLLSRRIAEAVDRAWGLAGVRRVRLLLENTAAAGTTFGEGPDEMGAVLHLLKGARDHVGVCLDTCHAHAAGYDLTQAAVWDSLVRDFERCCGMPIEAMHANDCAFGAGMHKDRHAWVGDGTIGYEGFSHLFAEPCLATLPIIIEMPGEIPVKDAENITRLKLLRDASGGSSATV
jgi:hypothetical protein